MTLLQSIILGIVQGISEFLPISSSAHLVIVPYLLGWDIPPEQAFVFDVLVQNATLVGVIVYFWKDLQQIIQATWQGLFRRDLKSNPASRLGLMIILATIPALVIGFFLKGAVEKVFADPFATAFFLLVNALILVIAEKIGKRTRTLEDLVERDAIWIGFAQVLAIFPGISRSGSTIFGGMARNLQRVSAAKFSLLMSIPVMLAAGGYAALKLIAIPDFWSLLPVFIPGFVTAGVVGYFSIRWLLKYLTHATLFGFALYCLLVGLIVIGFSYFS